MFVERALDLRKLIESKSHFLFGPRQTGKTSLIRHQLPEVSTINLLESDTFLQFSREPRLLREQCTGEERFVIIDEIQRLPSLLDEVHLLIEEQRIHFLLTGSSARKLRSGGSVNLLGGRARSIRFHPLSFVELRERFDLLRALNRGLLPSIYLSDEPGADLRAYAGDYLTEEIAAEGLTRNVPAFSRFLEVAATCNGQLINYTNVANDAQVARSTVQEYFQILRDTLIGHDLPAWRRSTKRKPIVTSKFYFFDVGVVRHLQNRGRLKRGSPDFGDALETYLFHELRTYCDYHGDLELAFWRSQSGYEVDFVLAGRTAIEVKASDHVSSRHFRGLKALREEGDLDDFLLVCLESTPRRVDGIRVVPLERFLEDLWSHRLS